MQLLRSLGQRANYPYAVARIQAKRSKLIPASEFDKLVKMDVAEITRYIQDSAYKAEVDELASKFSGLDLLEAALVVNEERTFADIRNIVTGPGGELIALWLERFVVEDLKTLLRGKNAGASKDELLKELLLENQAAYDFFAPLAGEDVKGIEGAIAGLEARGGEGRFWGKVLRAVPAGSTLPRYEDALDKAHYARVLGRLKELGDKAALVRDFVRREIDTVNLLNAGRWVLAGADGDFSPYVVPGGKHLGIGDVLALAKSKDLGAFGDALKETRLHNGISQGLADAQKTKRLAPLAVAAHRALLADLDKLGHGNPLSILPILIYVVRKDREVRTLRAVARGRAAGLSEARLTELLP